MGIVYDSIDDIQKIDSICVIAEGKQDVLVSGTDIKTINGESVLGSGDINTTSSISDINDIANVNTSGVANGQILSWDGTNSCWIASDGGGGESLSDICISQDKYGPYNYDSSSGTSAQLPLSDVGYEFENNICFTKIYGDNSDISEGKIRTVYDESVNKIYAFSHYKNCGSESIIAGFKTCVCCVGDNAQFCYNCSCKVYPGTLTIDTATDQELIDYINCSSCTASVSYSGGMAFCSDYSITEPTMCINNCVSVDLYPASKDSDFALKYCGDNNSWEPTPIESLSSVQSYIGDSKSYVSVPEGTNSASVVACGPSSSLVEIKSCNTSANPNCKSRIFSYSYSAYDSVIEDYAYGCCCALYCVKTYARNCIAVNCDYICGKKGSRKDIISCSYYDSSCSVVNICALNCCQGNKIICISSGCDSTDICDSGYSELSLISKSYCQSDIQIVSNSSKVQMASVNIVSNDGHSGAKTRVHSTGCVYICSGNCSNIFSKNCTFVSAEQFVCLSTSCSSSSYGVTISPTSGTVKICNLPTADPSVVNQLWNDGGVLKISAG